MTTPNDTQADIGLQIAVTGIACRFPGAQNVEEFWQNLRNGVESISFFSDEDLEKSYGFVPSIDGDKQFIRAGGVLEGIDMFDAFFFGYSPKEAEVMDPQHRFFLECAWEALESAGYDVHRFQEAIGVYAGASADGYFLLNIASNAELFTSVGEFQLTIANNKDHLPTSVSYKLNLKGPSINVQTSCSTSLVATHLACQALLAGECDVALAGGVSINATQKAGYLYEQGGINSPDGHCRAFDADAGGTVYGSGVGVVVLRRLDDALAAGDNILAVIKGSAINNDGSQKVGYTAPGLEGQFRVIKAAQMAAAVEPETISYIEAHGTGTQLGDPIEVAALSRVFREANDKKGYCALGSVKTNIGHLDAAAGAAGLIKTVLCLRHRELPASLHFARPNPNIDFENSPFYVNAVLSPWLANGRPLRAAVSSFGIGGTNCHMILEEAPASRVQPSVRPKQLIVLSAKTPAALDRAAVNLKDYLKANKDESFANVAYTLRVGRAAFNHRRMLIAADANDAIAALESLDPDRVIDGINPGGHRPVTFMFPGGGSQHMNMAREIYQIEPLFRDIVDQGCEILRPLLGCDLRQFMFPAEGFQADLSPRLEKPTLALPALLLIEYAMARLLMSWGIEPESLIGHSLGEYAAACLSGVFSFQDALTVAVVRGRLFDERMPKGEMISVAQSAAELAPLIGEDLSIAAINAPRQCVVSGPGVAIAALSKRLASAGIEFQRIHIDTAAHSKMVDDIVDEFIDYIATLNLSAPSIPFLSNVTGTWIEPSEAVDPKYWGKHLRQTVLFERGLEELMKEPDRILLEIGPGRGLVSLAKMLESYSADCVLLSSMRHPKEQRSDLEFLLNTVGRLWLAGGAVNFEALDADEQRRRVKLPSYPFERRRYWIEPGRRSTNKQRKREPLRKERLDDWFYMPGWKQSAPPTIESEQLEGAKTAWLILLDTRGFASALVKRLREAGHEVVTVEAGQAFAALGEDAFAIDRQDPDDYQRLTRLIESSGRTIGRIVHCWTLSDDRRGRSLFGDFDEWQARGFYSLLYLAKSLSQRAAESVRITVISTGLHAVTGAEHLTPAKATVLGTCKVMPQEYPGVTTQNVDIVLPSSEDEFPALVERVLAELLTPARDKMVALRATARWVDTFERIPLTQTPTSRLRERGVYVISGGLGMVGMELASYLAKELQARLVMIGRSSFPERAGWEDWLASHDLDDETSRRIRRLLEFESRGAEVCVITADIGLADETRRAIDETLARFGRIDGVIHAAVVKDHNAYRPLQELSKPDCELHFGSKARGLLNLAQALEGGEPDFCLLLSSTSAILGGLGYAAYSAANAFLDSVVKTLNNEGRATWLAADWDVWRGQETLIDTTGPGASLARLSMSPTEGIEVFKRVAGIKNLDRVVISTGDLNARIIHWIQIDETARSEEPQAEASRQLHERPAFSSSRIAPSNWLEQAIADIWQEELGIRDLGVHDDFFELGGHSLLAVKLVSRMRKAFGIELSLSSLFTYPTISKLAATIVKAQAVQTDDHILADMLERLDTISDEEARMAVAESGQSAASPGKSE
jgi:acyl transferase domain-containing protein